MKFLIQKIWGAVRGSAPLAGSLGVWVLQDCRTEQGLSASPSRLSSYGRRPWALLCAYIQQVLNKRLLNGSCLLGAQAGPKAPVNCSMRLPLGLEDALASDARMPLGAGH